MNKQLSEQGQVLVAVIIIMAIIVAGMVLVSNPSGTDIFTRGWAFLASIH